MEITVIQVLNILVGAFFLGLMGWGFYIVLVSRDEVREQKSLTDGRETAATKPQKIEKEPLSNVTPPSNQPRHRKNTPRQPRRTRSGHKRAA